MKRAKTSLRKLLNDITPEERAEARLSFQISNRLDFLIKEKGLSKKQLADAIGHWDERYCIAVGESYAVGETTEEEKGIFSSIFYLTLIL